MKYLRSQVALRDFMNNSTFIMLRPPDLVPNITVFLLILSVLLDHMSLNNVSFN